MKSGLKVKKTYESSLMSLNLSNFYYQSRSRHFGYLNKIDLNKLTQSLYLKYINSIEAQKEFGASEPDLSVINLSFQSKFFSERNKFRYLIEGLSKSHSSMYTIYSQDSFVEQGFSNLRYLKDILKNISVGSNEKQVFMSAKKDTVSESGSDSEDRFQLEPKTGLSGSSYFFNSKTLIRLQNTLISNHTSNERIKRKTERREVVRNIYPLVEHMCKYMFSSISKDSEVVFNQKGFFGLSLLEENKKIFMKEVSLFKRYKKDLSCDDGWGVFSFVSKGQPRRIMYQEYMMMDDYLDYDFNLCVFESVVNLLTGLEKKLEDLKNIVLICPDWDISLHLLKPFLKHKINYSSIFMDDMLFGWNPTISMLNFLYKKGLSALIRFDSFPYYEIYVID